MSLIDHAKRELKLLDVDDAMMKDVLELIEVFSRQGHSGGSACQCASLFEKLVNYEILTPINCSNDEFNEIDDGVYQNKRCISVFKDGKDGKPYYIHAIIFRDQRGFCFTGSARLESGKIVSSGQFIRTPFMEKKFYVDTVSKKVDGGNWESFVVDGSQLEDVFEYYDRREL